jgi:hypothetical protein
MDATLRSALIREADGLVPQGYVRLGRCLLEPQLIAFLGAASVSGARRQLQAVACPRVPEREAPWAEVYYELGDPPIPVQEDEIDGIAHERRIDGRGSGEEEALAGVDPRQQVETKDQLEETAGHLAAFRHDGAASLVGDADVSGHARMLAGKRTPRPDESDQGVDPAPKRKTPNGSVGSPHCSWRDRPAELPILRRRPKGQ